MKRWQYTYAGLSVVSELMIPEWDSFQQPLSDTEVDVHISVADITFPEVKGNEYSAVIGSKEYRFHVPEIGYFDVINGQEITVRPLPGAGPSEVRLFLLGSAWGALCYQRGLLVFHVGAVQVDNGVVVFCGKAGMGKSSITAWLASHGYPLVSDDLCRFDLPPQGDPIVYPSAPRLKLWTDILFAMGQDCEKLERDHFRFDKFHLPWTGKKSQQPLPLHRIYLLEWGELGIKRLSGREAMSRFLTAATYRGELLEPMGKLGRYWDSCLELLSRVPVWELKRPRDLSAMAKTVKFLEDHWGGNWS